jgi:membrane-bound hydrogenase subunit mbhJ
MILKKLCSRAFTKSLWIYHVNTGSCNGCDIEIVDVITPFYDAERFGIKLAGSPRHADIMLVSGPVTRQALPSLKRAYAAIPDPKLVIVVGSCGCGGNLWFDTYNVTGGVDKVIPVNYYIPGCPPRPEAILYGVAVALGLAPKKVGAEASAEGPIREGMWK